MKKILIIIGLFSICIFKLISCCKGDVIQIEYSKTDSLGNFIGNTARQGYFAMSNEERSEGMDSFFMQSIGFIPFRQNCFDTSNVIMYPNPISAGKTPNIRIRSTAKVIDYVIWPNNGSSLTGARLSVPTHLINTEHRDMTPISGSMRYNFMIVTEDSCVYFTYWDLIRQ